VHRAADVQPDPAGGEFVDNVTRVRDGAGEPVELGDDEGVAAAASRESFAQSRSFAVGPVNPWST